MGNGMEYGMDYGTHLVYHKHANYVAMPITTTCTKGEVIAVVIHVCVHVSPQQEFTTVAV